MAEDAKVIEAIEKIANSEKDRKTKAAAIAYLAKTSNAKYRALYDRNINDISYSVAGAALEGIIGLEPTKAYELAKKYSKDAKGALGATVNDILVSQGTEADFEFIATAYKSSPATQDKIQMTDKFGSYLAKLNDTEKIKTGIGYILDFRNLIPEQFWAYVDPAFKAAFDKISKAKGPEMENYIKTKFN